jgi:hypothetical protein
VGRSGGAGWCGVLHCVNNYNHWEKSVMQLKSIIHTATATVGLALACALPAQAAGTWETTLKGRDVNRNAVAATDASAVYLYDTALNVTWLRDANANGKMNWNTATNWAANLTTGSGTTTVDDWRLPTMTDTGAPGCDWSIGGTDCGWNPATSTSEMASLFFNTLGNKAYYDTSGNTQAGYGLTNTGSFQNMQSYGYWLGTEYAPQPNNAWYFDTYDGRQNANRKYDQLYAMAVRPGDVLAAVPEPETYMMLLLGLGAVGALSRTDRKFNRMRPSMARVLGLETRSTQAV